MANKQFNKNQPQKNFFKKFKKRVDKLNYMCYNKYSNLTVAKYPQTSFGDI